MLHLWSEPRPPVPRVGDSRRVSRKRPHPPLTLTLLLLHALLLVLYIDIDIIIIVRYLSIIIAYNRRA